MCIESFFLGLLALRYPQERLKEIHFLTFLGKKKKLHLSVYKIFKYENDVCGNSVNFSF